MDKIKAYAAMKAGGKLEPFEYDPGPLKPDEVEIKMHYCGLCHSDLSMLKNDWQSSTYPLVPGHEVVGEISSVGDNVKHLKTGQVVGLGWYSKSCMICRHCTGGEHNLCDENEQTLVGRHGGFADSVRCHWRWAIPLPLGLSVEKTGPLFCGGITVFTPIKHFNVAPTDRVGVVGIGGLGHMALQFLNKWGCHVTAFTSTPEKSKEALIFGAHEIVDSRDDETLSKLTKSLDFLLVTVNVPLNWNLYLNMLNPKGNLHFVGAVLNPLQVSPMSIIGRQLCISGSPLGSPITYIEMLEFCKRHNILPQTELFPMSSVNDAIEHLEKGKARYRVVLQNDF